jgi:hypothetical protein
MANRAAAMQAVIEDNTVRLKDVTYPTLSVLQNRVTKRQKQVRWTVNPGGAAVTRGPVVNDAVDNNTTSIQGATLAIGDLGVSHTFSLDLTEVEQAASIGAIEELKDLVGSHIDEGLIATQRDINQLILTGNGGAGDLGITGLIKLLDPTLSYAGLAPATYPDWRCSVTNAGANLTQLLTDDFLIHQEKMTIAGAQFDIIVTNPTTVTQYARVFDSRRQFAVAAGPTGADLGISDVTYLGRPIIADPMCPPGVMLFLDSSGISIHTYTVKGDSSFGGLNVKMGPLGVSTVYGERWQMGIIPQVKVHDRKRHLSAIIFDDALRTSLNIPA